MEVKSVDLDQALKSIRALDQACDNLNGAVNGPREAGWNAYMNWAEECERQLRNIFADPQIINGVYTDRYWHIAGRTAPAREAALIMAEVRVQRERLQQLATTLEGYQRLGDREGTLLVLDTNVLLHFQRIDKIRWREVYPADKIRIVLPLVVLDELDRKRTAGGKISRRARSATRPLDERQSEFEELGHIILPDFTTVEYLLDPRGHRRLSDADEEILDRATFLHRVTGRPVYVVTDDLPMRVRATARENGVRAIPMPEKFRRDQEEDDEA